MTKKRTFRLNKLVRDGIASSTVEQGGEVKMRKLSGQELQLALAAKIIEEAQEVDSASSVEELADLQEALDQYARNAGISRGDITKAQEEKRAAIGGFQNGDFIETVTLPEDSKWVNYYASQPERFLEITE